MLFDMETPGVSVKPIKLISGMSPFCETFLDDVRVPKSNLVFEENKGWTVGKALAAVRAFRPSVASAAVSAPRRWKSTVTATSAPTPMARSLTRRFREGVLKHRMKDRAFALTMQRSAQESATGLAPGALSSMFKYYGTEQNKNKYELWLAMAGTQAMGWDGEAFDADELTNTRAWLRSKANSIEGGTSEVQLNIIAKRILGLPD